jgi:hypothetical protein
MSDERCQLTDLIVWMCAHCRGDVLDPVIEADDGGQETNV